MQNGIRPRHRVLLWALAAVAVVLLIGQPGENNMNDVTTEDNSNLVLLHSNTADAAPYDEILLVTGDHTYEAGITGTVNFIYSDDENLNDMGVDAYIAMSNGELVDIDMDRHIALKFNEGEMVSATGILFDTDASSDLDPLVMDVQTITEIDDDISPATVEGNEKWVNIACRFGDMPEETPRDMDYFEGLMANELPGMDHYWRRTSTGLVDIEGTEVYGWYNLPKGKSSYAALSALNIGMALQQLLNDCAAQAKKIDNVDFDKFGGVNVMLNDTFGCCAWGGRMALTVGGTTRTVRTTWMPPWAFNSLHVMAHEMGHGWGLPHSSGPYGQVYDSAWDVMSGGSRMVDECRVEIDGYGCQQVGTIGFHLNMLGWLPTNRVVELDPGESVTTTLNPLTMIQGTGDTLLINAYANGNRNQYITIEARAFIGYDANLPGEAVIMHTVNTSRTEPANVVDADGNGNPNDEGAMWRPGEGAVFTDVGIEVYVLERKGDSFVVKVINNGTGR